ncbi:polysaccharide deacetylase family protein [Chloroflexi bacterium TSY]|nr:polysaccharide deacetylase family protein [Chloroflexi bacterium TSY]
MKSSVDWCGHSFAFILRVDVEHVEAEKYTGDFRTTLVSVTNLLDLFAEMGVHHSFAVLGITAELYPNLIQDIAAEHEIFGHSMFHYPALAGLPLADQRHRLKRMSQSIEDVCGVRVRGLAVPHHGLADENTLRAAAETGLDYVLSRIRSQNSLLPQPRQIAETGQTILVNADLAEGASDWSDRRRDEPWIEEAFSPTRAREKWMAMIDRAKSQERMCSLVIHPWMLMINPGEVQVVKDVITYAREQGAWLGTYDQLADLAVAQGS